MWTLLLYALLAILVIAGLFLLAVFVLPKGEQIALPSPDTRPWEALPDHQLRPEDVVAARLPVALRGYRFAETDLLLDRLTDELRERDQEIARLRGARPAPDGLRSRGEGGPSLPDERSTQVQPSLPDERPTQVQPSLPDERPTQVQPSLPDERPARDQPSLEDELSLRDQLPLQDEAAPRE